MINRELINPQSIVVVGGSNNVHKPGGRIAVSYTHLTLPTIA